MQRFKRGEGQEWRNLFRPVRNKDVLHRVLQTIKIKKVNRTGHILRRNCLPKQIIERKIKEDICDGDTKKKT